MWFWYGVTRKSQNIIGKSTRLSGTMYNYISDAENIVNQSFGKRTFGIHGLVSFGADEVY